MYKFSCFLLRYILYIGSGNHRSTCTLTAFVANYRVGALWWHPLVSSSLSRRTKSPLIPSLTRFEFTKRAFNFVLYAKWVNQLISRLIVALFNGPKLSWNSGSAHYNYTSSWVGFMDPWTWNIQRSHLGNGGACDVQWFEGISRNETT